MKDLREIDIVYFIGIGGIGMSALARFFNRSGKTVMGYDRTSSALTTDLELEGISIGFHDSVADLPSIIRVTPKEKVLVVYTPAVPANHQELSWFRSNGFSVHKRSEVLGWITQDHKTIAIAGTHGKTTTSSLIAHILHVSGHGCNAFLGGITANYSSNLLYDHPDAWHVVEADEFDRSFLALSPDVAVITSLDADHLDIYGTAEEMAAAYRAFADRLNEGGTLYCTPEAAMALHRPCFTYSAKQPADFRASEEEIRNGQWCFNLRTPKGIIENIPLNMPGEHNKENTSVAVAIALQLGVTEENIKAALQQFRGVKRRFEYQQNTGNVVFIDDYAHHPNELKATIEAARKRHPSKRLTGVFQPHLFTRTRDHIDDFAKVLSGLDVIYLLEIYPAREAPIEGVDSQWLLDKITNPRKKLVNKTDLLDALKCDQPEVILTLGAGDIDRLVEPIRKTLEERYTQ